MFLIFDCMGNDILTTLVYTQRGRCLEGRNHRQGSPISRYEVSVGY